MMRTCGWCGEPATTTVELEPVVTKKVKGEQIIVRAARTAPVCAQHADITDRGTPPQPPIRRKPGPDQTTVFDFLDAA